MARTHQLWSIWEAEFGNEWTKRNYMRRAELREPFWAKFLEYIPDVGSILEIGCNVGMNLHGLYKVNPNLEIIGLEPNNYGYQEARKVAKGRWSIAKGDIFNCVFDKKLVDSFLNKLHNFEVKL